MLCDPFSPGLLRRDPTCFGTHFGPAGVIDIKRGRNPCKGALEIWEYKDILRRPIKNLRGNKLFASRCIDPMPESWNRRSDRARN